MPNRRRFLRCSCFFTCLFLGLTARYAGADCKMVELGRFPVQLVENQIHIKGIINGTAVNILVDTGGAESVIMQDAAKRAGLKPVRESRYQMVGISGKTDVFRTRVPELIIGNFRVRDRIWPVIDASKSFADIGMILGADFWSKLDFEINLAAEELILWENRNCAKAALAYWNKDFMLALLAHTSDKIRADALVNGKEMRALLDTGASVSFIDRRVAERLGYRKDTAEGDPKAIAGIGNRGTLNSFVGIFDTFTLGDLTVQNAHLRIMDMEKNTQETGSRAGGSLVDFESLVLGADFLLANHVLIANSQHYLYMTYNGGPVFQTAATSASKIVEAVDSGNFEASENLSREETGVYLRANVALYKEQYAEAEPLFRQTLKVLEGNGRDATPEGLAALTGLAYSVARQKKHGEAEILLKRLLPLQEQALGIENKPIVITLELLGETLVAVHKYPEAVAALDRALPMVEKVYREGDPEQEQALINLGTALEGTADYKRAEDMYSRSVALAEKRSGANHPDTARALLQVARMEETQGRYQQAIETYQRARDMFVAGAADKEMLDYVEQAIAGAREAATR
jgi:predicted aspartyl protease